jgi:hypothetical protein
MHLLRSVFLSLGLLVAGVTVASANGFDPSKIPSIGTIAPAFGLQPFTSQAPGEGQKEVIQLDGICGLRPGETKGVLLVFLDGSQLSSLELLNDWSRRFSRDGLATVAISVDSNPVEFSSKVGRMKLRFPVLDDRHKIVAQRYGVSETPFSMLLNSECRVLGFSNKGLSEEEEALVNSIEALLSGQIGAAAGSMDD